MPPGFEASLMKPALSGFELITTGEAIALIRAGVSIQDWI
jgi:hypothetical protein